MDLVSNWCCGSPCAEDVVAGNTLLQHAQTQVRADLTVNSGGGGSSEKKSGSGAPTQVRLTQFSLAQLKLVAAAKAHIFDPRWLHEVDPESVKAGSQHAMMVAARMQASLAAAFPAEFEPVERNAEAATE
jgi:hypothetical protein